MTSALGVPVVHVDPILVDVYAGDLDGHPRWDKLVAAGPPWCGAILKATEGMYYAPPWFGFNWRLVKTESRERYGVDFWRGAYHYLRFNLGGRSQAQFFHTLVERAGGWDVGDLWPVLDVESANNAGATKQQVEDCVGDFVAESKRIHGREVILYGGSLLYDLGITSHMGCKAIIMARYTPTLPATVYQRVGWSVDELFGWQYAGVDGHGKVEAGLAGYPTTTPMGPLDMTALTWPGGFDALRRTQWAERPQ